METEINYEDDKIDDKTNRRIGFFNLTAVAILTVVRTNYKTLFFYVIWIRR